MQIKNQPATVTVTHADSTAVADETVGNNQSTGTETEENNEGRQDNTLTSRNIGQFQSFIATGNVDVLPFNEPAPTDVPSSATPGNLIFMPAAKAVATASTAANVDQNIFAMACVEALDVEQQSPSAYTAYVGSIADPTLRNAVSSFVAQNASVAASTLVDPYGNFNQTLVQQAKTFFPTGTDIGASQSTGTQTSGTTGTQATGSTGTQSSGSTGTQSSGSTGTQSSGSTGTQSSGTTATAGNVSSWPAISTNSATAQIYSNWAAVGTYPSVQSAASTVVADEAKLQSDQSWLNWANQGLAQAQSSGSAPDGNGTQQPVSYWQNQQQQAAKTLQGDWQNTRNDEAQFWYKLTQTTGGASAAQDQYQKYVNDPMYTTEGEMPQGFASAPLPSASTAAATSAATTNPVSSGTAGSVSSGTAASSSVTPLLSLPTLSASTSWPTNALKLLNDSNGAADMSKTDFEQLTEDFSAMYNSNPSQYFSTLAQVADPRLAGAINFTVNDQEMYNASSLRNNQAGESKQLSQAGNYFSDAQKGNFANWAPQNQGGASGTPQTTPQTIFSGTDTDSKAAVKLMQASSNTGMSSTDFGNAMVAFTKLYQSNPQQYYAALTEISDKKMRDLVNYSVLDTLSNHNSNATNASYYSKLFGKYGSTGFTGSSKGLSSNDGTTLNGKGPLSGSAWKKSS